MRLALVTLVVAGSGAAGVHSGLIPIPAQMAQAISAFGGDPSALTHIQKTDSPHYQADAYCDLPEVPDAAGRREDAITAWLEALDRYERKGIIPLARRVGDRLSTLTETSG